MAKSKRKQAKTPLVVETPKQELTYIGRKRETAVAGIKFELNKPTYVGDKALFDKLSKNPFFEVAK